MEVGLLDQLKARDLLLVRLRELTAQHKGHPELTPVLFELGRIDKQLKDYETKKAEAQENVRTKCRERLGEATPHVETAMELTKLGRILNHGGEIHAAKRAHEESVQMHRQLHPDNQCNELAGALGHLGLLHRQQGDLDKALQVLEESVRIWRAVEKNSDQCFADTLHELGKVHADRGNFQAGEESLKESLEMTRSLPKTELLQARTLRVLGQTCCKAGHMEEAETYWKMECLSIENVLSGGQEVTKIVVAGEMYRFATACEDAGDSATALRCLEWALHINRRENGSAEHPGVAAVLQTFGLMALKRNDPQAAKQHLQDSLKMTRDLQGRDQDIAHTLIYLSRAWVREGNLPEAKKCMDEAMGLRHMPDVAVTGLRAISLLCEKRADAEAGARYLQICLQKLQYLHGEEDHPDIAETLRALGRFFGEGDVQDVKVAQKAKDYLRDSLQMKRRIHGNTDHPEIAAALYDLGYLCDNAGDPDAAKRYLQESLRMNRALHGNTDQPGIAAALHLLGNLRGRAGDLETAKQCLQDSIRHG
ncbi:unnamed protein product [Effrenium voratum]|nr:unnamed protein product [Effrenium voratum]